MHATETSTGLNLRADLPVHSGAQSAAMAVAPAVILLVTFLWAFVAAFHQPRPHDLPLGIVAPAPERAAIQAGLSSRAPGVFHVEPYDSIAPARSDVSKDVLNGALIVQRRQALVLVAGAGGEAAKVTIVAALSALARKAHLQLAVRDLRPLPSHDPLGLSAFFVVFGVVIAAVVFGALLYLQRESISLLPRLGALIVYAVLAAICTAFVVDPLLGALTGHFWYVAFLAGLLTLAVGGAMAALTSLFRLPGIGLAVLLLVILGNSTAGGPVPYRFLPDGLRQVSQFLPSGAGVTALRHAVYFGGQEMAAPLLVLVGWAAVGFLVALGLSLLGRASRRRPIAYAAPLRPPAGIE